MNKIFEDSFQRWTQIACDEWGYDMVPDVYYEKVFNRLPHGLRCLLGYGIKSGLIKQNGKEFTLQGLDEKKGPYNWLSRDSCKKEPAVNWEYCVHVAEYVRLYELADRNKLHLTFEDDSMDIALYNNGTLIVCCEVKEKTSELMKILQGIRIVEQEIDFNVNDRQNDFQKEGKYIVKNRPKYFYLISIGTKLEFRVEYPKDKAFLLKDDFIPYI